MAGHYAVIFTSQRTALDHSGYEEAAKRMLTLAVQQPGYPGIDDVRNADGIGITISYWTDLKSIRLWREQSEHLVAQETGREKWYEGSIFESAASNANGHSSVRKTLNELGAPSISR